MRVRTRGLGTFARRSIPTVYLPAFAAGIIYLIGAMNAREAIACESPPSYTLIAITSDNTKGTTSLSPPGTGSFVNDRWVGIFSSGTSVTVTAIPLPGYVFSHWTGALTSSNAQETVVVNMNKTVTAHFTAAYTLTTATAGTGTISPSGGSYSPNTTVNVTASPGSGWRFDHWEGDLSGSTASQNLTMNSNKSITAYFVQVFTLTTGVEGSGAVTPSGGTFDAGTQVNLTPDEDAGWRFHHWEGDLSGSANPGALTMNANKSVTAVFYPGAGFEVASSSAAESATTVYIAVELTAASSEDVTVPFAISGGTAVSGTDFTVAGSSVLIPASQTAAEIPVSITPDTLDENAETVVITLQTPANAVLEGVLTHTLTLTDDDDPPVVQFPVASGTTDEGGADPVIALELSTPSGLDITVPFTHPGVGTATAGDDYSVGVSSVTIPAGALGGTVQFALQNDVKDEYDETVIVALGSPINATLGLQTVYTQTITDNDDPPFASFVPPGTSSHAEEAGNVPITITLSEASGKDVTVSYNAGGTATGVVDYSLSASPLILPAGSISGEIVLTLVEDGVNEAEETVEIAFGVLENAQSGTHAIHTASIGDDDPEPEAGFSTASTTGAEDGAGISITVALNGPSGRAIAVPFSITGGSATPGTDFTVTASPLTFAAGETSKSVVVTPADDSIDESDETIEFELGVPDHATLTGLTTHTATLADNDAAPVISFSTTESHPVESGVTVSVTVDLAGESEQVVTVPYTVSGSAAVPADYSIDASPLVFNPGETTGTITVVLQDDALDEAVETVELSLGTPSNGTLGANQSHVMSIADDDAPPEVRFEYTDSTDEEADELAVAIPVNLNVPSGQPVTVEVAIAGTAQTGADYAITGIPLVFLPGDTAKTIDIAVVNDTLNEFDESVELTLENPANATLGSPSTHTFTLVDEDSIPEVTFLAPSSSAIESDGMIQLDVELSVESGKEVVVPFSFAGTVTSGGVLLEVAVDGADYETEVDELVFAPGETTKTIDIGLSDDLLDENEEVLAVTLEAAEHAAPGAITTHTVTIADNDTAPVVEFVLSGTTVPEFAPRSNILLTLSSPSGQAVSVPYNLGGDAQSSGYFVDYIAGTGSVMFQPGDTSAVIPVTIINDQYDEENETVEISLEAPGNATLGVKSVHTLILSDNDDPPEISLFESGTTNSASTVPESIGQVQLPVALSALSCKEMTVHFVVGGTATPIDDFTITESPILFGVHQQGKFIDIPIVDDEIHEADETVIITLDELTNAEHGISPVYTLTIEDDDPPPAITIELDDDEAPENSGEVVIRIELDQPSGRPVTVKYTYTSSSGGVGGGGGSGGGGASTSGGSGYATFPPGTTSRTFTIYIQDDNLDEEPEIIDISLSEPDGGTIAPGEEQKSIAVSDDDPPPTVFFAINLSTVEEDVAGGSATVEVKTSTASGLPVTVDYAISGGDATGSGVDYSLADGTLTFPPGDTSKTFDVFIFDDSIYEGEETVEITLLEPENATLGVPPEHTLYILDDEPAPTVSFASPSSSVPEGQATVELEVELSYPASEVVSVTFDESSHATYGSEYTISASPVVFPAGETDAVITVTLTGDTLDENDEELIVSLLTPTNGEVGPPTYHTLTLLDDDPEPEVSFDNASSSTNEGGAAVAVAVSLSEASGREVTVPIALAGTATAGADYAINYATVVIPAGSITQTITVTPQEDLIDESSETAVLLLDEPVNAQPGSLDAHVVTIQDNDLGPTVQFAGGTVQAPGTLRATFSEADPVAPLIVRLSNTSGLPVTVSYSITNQSAIAGEDFTVAAGPAVIPVGAIETTIDVLPIDDIVAEGDVSLKVTLTSATNATGGTYRNFIVILSENESTLVAETSDENHGTVSLDPPGGVYTNGTTVSIGADPAPGYTLHYWSGNIGGTATPQNLTINGDAYVKAHFGPGATLTNTIVGGGEIDPPGGYYLKDRTIFLTAIPDPGWRFDHWEQDLYGNTNPAPLNMSGDMEVTAFFVEVCEAVEVESPGMGGGNLLVLPGGGSEPGQLSGGTSIAAAMPDRPIGLLAPYLKNDLVVSGAVPALGIPRLVTANSVVEFETACEIPVSSVLESAGSAAITVVLDQAQNWEVYVPYEITGTATDGVDFSIDVADESPLIFPEEEDSVVVNVTIFDDSDFESDEVIILTLLSDSTPTTGFIGFHTLTIEDNDGEPTVEFESATSTEIESGYLVEIPVSLSNVSEQEISVNYVSVGGTAEDWKDYEWGVAPFVPWSDDFEDLDIAGWSGGGGWGAAGGHLQNAGAASEIHTTQSNADFQLEFDYRSEAAAVATIYLRGDENGDTLELRIDNTQDSWALYETVDAVSTQLDTATLASDPGAWYDVHVLCDGPGVTVSRREKGGTDPRTLVLEAVSATVVASESFAIEAGTDLAIDNVDVYPIVACQLVFQPGEQIRYITLYAVDDPLDEPDETVGFQLLNPINATLGGEDAHTLTIQDNDLPPAVNFALASSSAPESVTDRVVSVTLSEASSYNIPLSYSIGGTADGTDFSMAAGPLVFIAGETSKTIGLSVVDDEDNEGAETIAISLTSADHATLGTGAEHVVTIENDDNTASIATASQTVGEGDGTATVTVELAEAALSDIVISYTLGGTAAETDDYTAPASVTIVTGQTSADVDVTLVDDPIDEEDEETLTLTLMPPLNAVLGGANAHTITIADNDVPPTVEFNVEDSSAAESVTFRSVPVSLDTESGKTVTVPYGLGGTAATPSDFAMAAGPLVFAPGEVSKSIPYTVGNDVFDEEDETIEVTLGTPVNANLGAGAVHTATIEDDDTAPDVLFSAAASGDLEVVSSRTVQVVLSIPSDQVVTVPYSVGGAAEIGADFEIAAGDASPLVFGPGVVSKLIHITILNEELDEFDETVVLTILEPENGRIGGAFTHTLQITNDDDPPSVSFGDASSNAVEGAGAHTIPLGLSAASGREVTVPFVIGGTAAPGYDYTASGSPVVFPPGVIAREINIDVHEDALDEDGESIIVTLPTPTGATIGSPAAHTVTIDDNDDEPVVQFANAASNPDESAGAQTLNLTLSAPSGRSVTVPFHVAGAATEGSDYTLTASPLMIPAGETSGSIVLTVNEDPLDEDAETVEIILDTPVNASAGATSTHTATIADNDELPSVQFAISGSGADEFAGSVAVAAQLSSPSGREVSVGFALSGTALADADYSVSGASFTIPEGDTSANITLYIVDDLVDEPDESVEIALNNPQNATIGATAARTLLILDDDLPAPNVAVGEITSPTPGTKFKAGDSVTITFGVGNAGLVGATAGTWGSAVYLSRGDALGEAPVKLLAVQPGPDIGGGGGTATQSITFTMPDVSPGRYYFIVQADVGDVFPEVDEENDLSVDFTLLDAVFTNE